jgi:hypothetical protein
MGKHTHVELKLLTPQERMQIVERLCGIRVLSLHNMIKRNDWNHALEGIKVCQKQVSQWIRDGLLDNEFNLWRSRSLQQ